MRLPTTPQTSFIFYADAVYLGKYLFSQHFYCTMCQVVGEMVHFCKLHFLHYNGALAVRNGARAVIHLRHEFKHIPSTIRNIILTTATPLV